MKVTDTDRRFVRLDEIRTQFITAAAHKLREGFRVIAEAEDPQELMDKYGSEAAGFFADFMAAGSLLTGMGAEGLPAPTGSFTPNADGTVTYTPPVTEPDPEPSEEA